jgi:hypothetical protein
MKPVNSLKVLGLSLISVLALQGCTDDSRSAPVAPVQEAVVQPTDVSTCNLRRQSYECQIDAQTPEGPARYRMSVEVTGNRRGSKTIVLETSSYKMDGRVHSKGNPQGIDFDYSVACSSDSFSVNVKASNAPHFMRFDMYALSSGSPTVQLLANGRNGRTQGSGTCYTSYSGQSGNSNYRR